jgi:hypothetical protein
MCFAKSVPPLARDVLERCQRLAGTTAMMPKRRHTRAANKAKAITAERKLNEALVAEVAHRNKPPPF